MQILPKGAVSLSSAANLPILMRIWLSKEAPKTRDTNSNFIKETQKIEYFLNGKNFFIEFCDGTIFNPRLRLDQASKLI